MKRSGTFINCHMPPNRVVTEFFNRVNFAYHHQIPGVSMLTPQKPPFTSSTVAYSVRPGENTPVTGRGPAAPSHVSITSFSSFTPVPKYSPVPAAWPKQAVIREQKATKRRQKWKGQSSWINLIFIWLNHNIERNYVLDI